MLEKINEVGDIKKLNIDEQNVLAKEIREYILDVVSKNGGHLASNLGVVDLTIALHDVFDLPKDKIIWDVGHQSYTHKILTGRKEELKSLRKFGGIAGFPKTNESSCDCFNTGHSSTSISAALGMARARDLKGDNYNVVAVIGDGALTGGIALEALNDAGYSHINMTVILNDNEMSISKNIGGINMLLSKIRTKRSYNKSDVSIKKVISKIPFVGKRIVRVVRRVKKSIKSMVIPKMFVEDIGFRYLGPVDGHNIYELERMLNISKQLDGPVFIHVLTKKGKGYKIAEDNADRFHATGPFNLETGEPLKKKSKDYSKVFGDKLISLAESNDKIVAITAAMKDGTGLKEFKERFPSRFFDVGIAEQHALCMAAGMAKDGMIPVVPIYSSFYQRAYDQVIHDIAIQNLPVVMCVDRAGIVGADGETHQGEFDMAFFRLVPNLVIMAPKDFKEFEYMLEFAINLGKPIAIRYPRGGEGKNKFETSTIIEYGKSEIIKSGNDITLIGIGKMVDRLIDLSKLLNNNGIDCEIINARFLKPLDFDCIKKSIIKTKRVVTIEDGTCINGLGTSVKEFIIDKDFRDVKIKSFAYPDEFIKHGSVDELEKMYKLDVDSIYENIISDRLFMSYLNKKCKNRKK